MHIQQRGFDHRATGGSAGGLWPIGIPMLISTGWWWPGAMLVVGGDSAAGALLRGRVLATSDMLLLFLAIPARVALARALLLPWEWVVGFALVASGGALRARGVLERA